MQEMTKLKGCYEIHIIDVNTKAKRIIKLDNQLTKLYQQSIVSALAGTSSNLQIKYIAFGTGATPASADNTTLEAEIAGSRKAPTVAEEKQGYFESTFVLLPAELANTNIKEIGIFAGSEATSAVNTGTMISRLNVDIEKTESQQIIFIRRDIINI